MAAFNKAIQEWTPEKKRGIIKTFEPFISKAKSHVKDVVQLTDKGLIFNLNKETWDSLIHGLVKAQGFLLQIPLQGVLIMFEADSFTSFVKATQAWRNNPVTTIWWITQIGILCMRILGEKYVVADTEESISERVKAAFA
jgi:hypothetical protein